MSEHIHVLKIFLVLFSSIIFTIAANYLQVYRAIETGYALLVIPCILCTIWFGISWGSLLILSISIIRGSVGYLAGVDFYLIATVSGLVLSFIISIFSLYLQRYFRKYQKWHKEVEIEKLWIENLLTSLPTAIVIINCGTKKILYANNEMATLLQKDKIELIEKDADKNLCSCINNSVPEQIEWNSRIERDLKLKNGQFISIIEKIRMIYKGNIPFYIVSFLNVQDLKQASIELIENKNIFNTMAETAHDSLIMINNEGKISFFNHAVEELFGYSSEEAMDANLHSLITPIKYREKANAAFQIFRKSGKGNVIGKTVELEGLTRKGVLFPMELSLSSFFVEGEWHGLGTIRDLREKKKMDAELLHINRLEEESNRLNAVNQLAAGIAHDFNNIFAGIMGQAGILDIKLSGNDKLLKYVQNIKELTLRAEGFTDGLLTSLGSRQVLSKEIEILQFLIELVQDYKSENRAFQLNIDYSIYEQVLNIDGVLLKEALYAIFNNAFESISALDKKVVNVSLNREIKSGLYIGNVSNGISSYVCISIIDKGCGIEDENMIRIFEPFYTTKKFGNRAGLGLTKANGIIHQHNGFIEIESLPGVGTTIKVFLPDSGISGIKNEEFKK